MSKYRVPILALAIAALGLISPLATSDARAALRVTVTDGATTDVFYAASSNALSTGFFTIGGYNFDITTTLTNYSGSASIGSISTSINIGSTSAPLGASLNSTVEVIAAVSGVSDGLVSAVNLAAVNAASLIKWTAPATSPVTVHADAGASTNPSVKSGTVKTTTYYDSPGAVVGPGTPVVDSGLLAILSQTAVKNSVVQANSGTYTLSQCVALSGVNLGIAGFNFTGNSSVNPVPEPSAMAIAGLGVLGMIGYGLRRRRGA